MVDRNKHNLSLENIFKDILFSLAITKYQILVAYALNDYRVLIIVLEENLLLIRTHGAILFYVLACIAMIFLERVLSCLYLMLSSFPNVE